jgi:DNA polymerase V
MSAVIIGRGGVFQPLWVPLQLESVCAGFPSPAQDYVEQVLDLNQLCVQRPAATFFVRVRGDSMLEAGICPGDILVVDRSLEAVSGDTVVASLDNDFTVKELQLKPAPRLLPRNRRYPVIEVKAEQELEIFGVVVGVVRQMRRG